MEDKEIIEYIRKQQETSDIGKIYENARDTVFSHAKSEEEILFYLTTEFEHFPNDEEKIRFIDFLVDWIQKETKRPCMYKEIPSQHYSTIEKIKRWLTLQIQYYQNPDINFHGAITREFSDEQQKKLYFELTKDYPIKTVKESFMSGDYNDFCFVFGHSNYSYEKRFKCLVWKKNKQLLRELLEAVKNKDIRPKKMEDVVPKLFVDESRQPFILAKNKKKESIESDFIRDIIKELFP